jgi:hypothetical protein
MSDVQVQPEPTPEAASEVVEVETDEATERLALPPAHPRPPCTLGGLIDAYAAAPNTDTQARTRRIYANSVRGLLAAHLSQPAAHLTPANVDAAIATECAILSEPRRAGVLSAYRHFTTWAAETFNAALPALPRQRPGRPAATTTAAVVPEAVFSAAGYVIDATGYTHAKFLRLAWCDVGVAHGFPVYDAEGNLVRGQFLSRLTLPEPRGSNMIHCSPEVRQALATILTWARPDGQMVGPILPEAPDSLRPLTLAAFRAGLKTAPRLRGATVEPREANIIRSLLRGEAVDGRPPAQREEDARTLARVEAEAQHEREREQAAASASAEDMVKRLGRIPGA